MITPMLSGAIEIGDKPNQWARIVSEEYMMEPKLDGWRLLLKFDISGRLQAFTRTGRDVTDRLPQGWVDRVAGTFRVDTILDCEFGYTMKNFNQLIDFNKTARVMGSNADEAQRKAREHTDLPVAFVFDVLEYRGVDLTMVHAERRRDRLWDLLTLGGLHIRRVRDMGVWHEGIYTAYVERGGEGVMLKNRLATYQPGKRPTQTWYKVKKFDTIDVLITGFQDGEGKYLGQIGAIEFRDPVTGIAGKCSGMTDELRLALSKAPNAFFHTWMEVKYFGLTAGTPRHPQFVRLRPDR
jgi:ATP-dependent DNA ligase